MDGAAEAVTHGIRVRARVWATPHGGHDGSLVFSYRVEFSHVLAQVRVPLRSRWNELLLCARQPSRGRACVHQLHRQLIHTQATLEAVTASCFTRTKAVRRAAPRKQRASQEHIHHPSPMHPRHSRSHRNSRCC